MIMVVTRYFLISFILAATLSGTKAQEIKFGVKGGLNLADLGGDSGDTDFRLGIHAGGFVSIPVLTNFRVQPEILYSQQGAQADFGSDEQKYDYLNIPVMVKFRLTKNFNLHAGPQLGILLSAKEEFRGDEEDVKDTLTSTDIGVGFGLGYETSDNVSIDVRYNLGITDIVDDTIDVFSLNNQVIQVSLGIAF